MNLFIKKTVKQLYAESVSSKLKRSLGPWSLVSMGIGAVIGAGIFVRTVHAAGEHAGPGVMFSYIIAGLGCTLAGLCYAEFASMIPLSGSAYTYSYATLGEFIAWIIGWDLMLEYAFAVGLIAIAWSQYFNNLLEYFNLVVPYQWSHSPFLISDLGERGIVNLPSIFLVLVLTFVITRGTKVSSVLNSIAVVFKLTIILLFIILGWNYINPVNHTHFFIPLDTPDIKLNIIDPLTQQNYIHKYSNFWNHGWAGILSGAGVVFFAYIGFDAVSTLAQESRNPKKDIPIGILVSLGICTLLYILFSYVLTGIAPFTDFMKNGGEAAVVNAIKNYMPESFHWLSLFITIAILFGFSSVIIVLLISQTRIFYTMSKDGLVPPIFSELHPKYYTPAKAQWIFFVIISILSGFVPEVIIGNLTSIGTLFAFILVSVGILVLRKKEPKLHRPFRTPFVPLVPILSILVSGLMVIGLGVDNWLRLLAWLLLGLGFYFFYSFKHSKLRNPD